MIRRAVVRSALALLGAGALYAAAVGGACTRAWMMAGIRHDPRPGGACCLPNAPLSGGLKLRAPAAGAPIDSAPDASQPRPEAPSERPRATGSRWLHPTIRVSAQDDEVTRPYQAISFGFLGGFEYQPRKPWELLAESRKAGGKPAEIPRGIRTLSGKRVAIEGFMMPMDYDRSGVAEFILNGRYDMCAFGVPARLNDWVLVRMKEGRRTRFAGHFPVWVYGRLEVGERWSGDQVESLYRLEADFIGVSEETLGG
jgi:hypothetical protein